MKMFWRVLIWIVLMAVMFEGVSAALWLMNLPFDLALLGGVLMFVVSVAVPFWIGSLLLRKKGAEA